MYIQRWIKKNSILLISLTLALIVIFIAIKQGKALVKSLKIVELDWMLYGFGCYSLNYLLRAFRIKVVLNNRIRLWPDAVYTACLHGLTTYLLPFRSGDFTLPVILNKLSNLKFSSGAQVLISVRVLDCCALGLWILTAAVLIDFSIPGIVYMVWIVSGVGLAILPFLLNLGIELGRKLQTSFFRPLLKWEAGAAFSIEEIVISLGIWACVGACFFCTTKAIGLPLGFMEVWLLIAIQLPLQLVPLQGVANAGNHEGGWVAGLALLGVSTDQGIHYALLSHALIMTYVLALCPSAFLLKIFLKKNIYDR